MQGTTIVIKVLSKMYDDQVIRIILLSRRLQFSRDNTAGKIEVHLEAISNNTNKVKQSTGGMSS